MAEVCAALDLQTNRRVALKRLQAATSPETQRRNVELFEHEFHTLAQLAHPRVVAAYDFGVDADGVYYTMELLDGGDLQQLAPLPWRIACAVARDVCSALSLLHSRRLVHRDLSPRNVRRAGDGRAKLIDFGAVAPMGQNKVLVGTPPCCAPESVHLQPLDARTDLYALGATLYYMLVGQHAYVARHFASLHEAWKAGFARPGELVAELPAALDALVLDLLRLDPAARPANAAEVIQRLSAIDGVAPDEQLQIAQAHLSTPTLVGRDAALGRVARRLRRIETGHGRSVLIEGTAGVGRSRFLDACVLAATLRGLAVVRADADDAVSGEYGVIRALARQLELRMPEAVKEAAAPLLEPLSQVMPELAPGALPSAGDASDLASQRARLQLALRQWLQRLSRQRPLVIAVDDMQAVDESSAVLLALLATESDKHAVGLVTSAVRDANWLAPGAREILGAASTRIQLERLSAEQSEQLLRSLFDDVPHLGLLAQRAHALCAGNPRDLLRLAQHLVDSGTARYDAGAFRLPAQLDATDLPSSITHALQARVDALNPSARALACALALCPERRFSIAECAQLGEVSESAQVAADIDALRQADIARCVGDQIGLATRSWELPLRARLSVHQQRSGHARLARIFAARGDQEFRVAQHWFWAGEPGRALDVLVPYASATMERAEHSLVIEAIGGFSEVAGWPATYAEALRACRELGRPPNDEYILLTRLVGLNALYNLYDMQPFAALFTHLRRDSGLDDWLALDAGLDPALRTRRALESAQARCLSTPERERVLAPAAAIRQTAAFAFSALGVIPPALDPDELDALPDLTAFVCLSPALQTFYQLHRITHARLTGQLGGLVAEYEQLLESLARPDYAGLTARRASYLRLALINAVAMFEAASGKDSCLEWAAKLELAPMYALNALLVRMLHAVFQADLTRAEAYRNAADSLRIEARAHQVSEGLHLLWEIDGHAIGEDLTRLRHGVDAVARLAARYPGWQPVLHYAQAEHLRIRRDAAGALLEVKAALALAKPGRHQLWANMAKTHVLVLFELSEHDAALALADQYRQTARERLGYLPDHLRLAHCLVSARAGRSAAASDCDALIARKLADGESGLELGYAHEIRARIASLLQDQPSWERHEELCRALYCAHNHPALAAKYQRFRASCSAT
jgi:hypothetical protein